MPDTPADTHLIDAAIEVARSAIKGLSDSNYGKWWPELIQLTDALDAVRPGWREEERSGRAAD